MKPSPRTAWIAPFVLATVAFVPAAHAQSAPDAPDATDVGDTGPRARFGINGALAASAGTHAEGFGLMGLAVDGGVQFNDRFALYVHAVGSMAIVSGYTSAGVLFEYAPTQSFAIALGPSANLYATLGGLFESAPTESDVGGTLAFAYTALHREPSGQRVGLRVALELSAGAGTSSYAEPGAGFASVFTFGWVTM